MFWTPKRGTRIPDDFAATDAMISWARENTPLVGSAETATFVDYWRAASGARAVKADWTAAWRYWMRKANAEAARRTNGRGYTSATDANIAQFLGRGGPNLRALPGGES
ncbi:hypothetical protein [Kutzneria chonburiensis]|uniref:hypothetical protein n=1 Tax=Kutzneria chonburiensis TaxID=1483604 RepID=UPI00236277E3|nr:hypothetical protein [Kutzneria chonburiensis]